jgi:tetratricopeptide (TPR) repeat protein
MRLFNTNVPEFIISENLEVPLVIPFYLPKKRKLDLINLMVAGMGNPVLLTLDWTYDNPQLETDGIRLRQDLINPTNLLIVVEVRSNEEIREANLLFSRFKNKAIIYYPLSDNIITNNKWLVHMRGTLIDMLNSKYFHYFGRKLNEKEILFLRRSFCDPLDIIDFFNSHVDIYNNGFRDSELIFEAFAQVMEAKFGQLSLDSILLLFKLITLHKNQIIKTNDLDTMDPNHWTSLESNGFIIYYGDLVEMRLPALQLRNHNILERTILRLGGIKKFGSICEHLYKNYMGNRAILKEDPRKLLLQKEIEANILIRPPEIVKLKRCLIKLGDLAKIEIPHDDTALFCLGSNLIEETDKRRRSIGFAFRAYYYLKNDDCLKESSENAKNAYRIEKSTMKEFCVNLFAYLAERSLFIGEFPNALEYFEDYLEFGGSQLRYLIKTGLTYQHIGDTNKAERSYNSALLKAKNIDDAEMTGRALLHLGILDRVEGRYDCSELKIQEAIGLFRTSGDLYHEGMALANLGVLYRLKENYNRAIDIYDKAFNIFHLIGDNYRQACVQGRRGTAYRMTEQYHLAIDNYTSALIIFREFKDPTREAHVLKELGTTYYMAGEYEEAIDIYNEALNVYSKHKNRSKWDRSREGQTIDSIGITYLIQGKWESAIEKFEEALEIFQNINDSFHEGQSLHNLGIVYLMCGRWNEAVRTFQSAIDIFDKSNNINYKCLTLMGLGTVLEMLNLFRDALDVFEEARSIIETLNDIDKEIWVLGKIGNLQRELHRYDDAINNYNRSLDLLKNSDNKAIETKDKTGWILGELGTVYRKLNRLDDAIIRYNSALDIFLNLGDSSNVSWILEELGETYVHMGSFNKAIEVYKQTLQILGKQGELTNESTINLAEVYVMMGIYNGAIKKYTTALRDFQVHGNRSLECRTLRNLGRAYTIIDEEKAIECLNAALKISKEIGDQTQEGKCLCSLGAVLGNIEDYDKAVDNIRKAIDIFKELADNFLGSWAMEQLGIVHLSKLKLDDAIIAFEEAISLNPEIGSVHLYLAECYRRKNNNERFKCECEQARKLLKTLEKTMIEYDRACLEAVCGNKKNALELLEAAFNKMQIRVNYAQRDPHLFSLRNDIGYRYIIDRNVPLSHYEPVPFM